MPSIKEEGATGPTPLTLSESCGLADIITPTPEDPGGVAETLQRAQLDSVTVVEKVRETNRKSPLSPVHTHQYALEVRIMVEVSPGSYAPPEDESYSADFIQDNLNLAYPGCMGVFLAEPGSVIAFYGKKGSSQAGLTVEQGMEACKIIGNITSWMGDVASVKVKAISLMEANELVHGMKRLEKESLTKARLDLCQGLSALQLGQNNTTLSASAKPFVPLATSSKIGVDGSVGMLNPPPPPLPTPPYQLSGLGVPRRPPEVSSSEDDGTTTDGTVTDSSVISTKKSSCKRGHRRGKNKKGSGSETGESGSETSSTTTSRRNKSRSHKKAGVTNKIQIPEFMGTADKKEKIAEDFRCWARVVTFYRDYYEDEFLMSQIIGVLKDDAADVFDYVRRRDGGTQDLGVIMQRMRNHYCNTLTFREQQNSIENMRQGSTESAADFLVRVSSVVESLERDFKGAIPKEEFDTLLYDVSFNGVNEDVWHVLNSEMARYGDLNADRMYGAVKKHEAYMAHHRHLNSRTALSSTTPATDPHASVGGHFKPRFQRPSVWVASAVEDLSPTPDDTEIETEGEVKTGTSDSPSGGSGGLFIPEFLEEVPDGNWGLMVRMTQAIKADKEKWKKCFACQSPDHFTRDCPVAKNSQGAPTAEGASQNKPDPAAAKARVVPSPPAQQVQVAQPPQTPPQNAPGN